MHPIMYKPVFPVEHTHTQLFYGSMDFVRDSPDELVPEETFTHYRGKNWAGDWLFRFVWKFSH